MDADDDRATGPALDVSTVDLPVQAIVEAPDAVIIADASGRIVLANRQSDRIFGYERGALEGRRVEILVPERYRDRHPGHRKLYFESPRTRPMGANEHLHGLRSDGSEFPAEISLAPLAGADQPLVIAAIRDVTDRVRAEQKFRDLLEAAPDAIVIVDRAGEIVVVNAQAENLFGYARAELLGNHVELLLPLRFRETHPERRSSYFRSPRVRTMSSSRDLVGRRKDGSEVPIEISLSPIDTEEGTLVAAAIRDVTERRLADAARHHLAAIVDSSEDAIIGKSLDGLVTSWNDGARAVFGYAAEDIVGQPVSVLVPPDRLVEEQALLERIRHGESIPPFETTRRHKSGRIFDVSETISPIRDARGVVVGASRVARDISEKKTAEKNLEQALRALADAHEEVRSFNHRLEQRVEETTADLQRERAALERHVVLLERSNLELQQFAYVTSHDLRGPLLRIVSFIQLARKTSGTGGPNTGDAWLEKAERSASHAIAMVDDVLEYSRVGSRSRPFEHFDVDAVLRDVLDELQLQISEAGASIEHRPIERALHADKTQVIQVFRNLLGNALKFRESASPTVKIYRRGESRGPLTLCFEDDGIGVPPEQRERIFQMFQRLHDDSTYVGSGIGLAICRRIMERHEGSIWVESVPTGGARFVVEFGTATNDSKGVS